MQRAAPPELQPTHTVTRRSKADGHRTTDRQLTDGVCISDQRHATQLLPALGIADQEKGGLDLVPRPHYMDTSRGVKGLLSNKNCQTCWPTTGLRSPAGRYGGDWLRQ